MTGGGRERETTTIQRKGAQPAREDIPAKKWWFRPGGGGDRGGDEAMVASCRWDGIGVRWRSVQ